MATKNPRINVTVSEETAAILALMAKQKKKTISATVNSLVEQAIEQHEDAYWLKIAKDREKDASYISSEEFWKKVL